VFDPEGPIYSPMANPEDPALRSDEEENAALDPGTEIGMGNHND